MLSTQEIFSFAEEGIHARLKAWEQYRERMPNNAINISPGANTPKTVDEFIEHLKSALEEVRAKKESAIRSDQIMQLDDLEDGEPFLEYQELEQIYDILKVHRRSLERVAKQFCGKSVGASMEMHDFSEALVEMTLRIRKCKKLESAVKAILDFLDQEDEYESI